LSQFAVLGLIVATGSARADLITVDLSKNLQQTQIDAAGDLSEVNDYFAARAFYGNLADFDAATLTYPGPGSPVNMTNVPGTVTFLDNTTAAGYFNYSSNSYGDQGSLDADFPKGSYEYDLSVGGNPAASAVLNYTSDLYTANSPIVSSASFAALQGADATQAIDVSFNQLQDNAGFAQGDQDFVFLDVFTSGFASDAYSMSSATPATTTNFVIPSNTLLPGTSYTLVLTFDNRISGGGGSQLFDTKTDVNFTTESATPEPAGFALAVLGLGAVEWLRRRRA
jgi:uncharacterized protein (TIGR03382 family)